jgi:hypothetical protein
VDLVELDLFKEVERVHKLVVTLSRKAYDDIGRK